MIEACLTIALIVTAYWLAVWYLPIVVRDIKRIWRV